MRVRTALNKIAGYEQVLLGIRSVERGGRSDAVRGRIDGLTKLSGEGPWGRGVPEALSLASVRRMSGLDEIAAFLRAVQIQTLEGLEAKTLAVIREL